MEKKAQMFDEFGNYYGDIDDSDDSEDSFDGGNEDLASQGISRFIFLC